MLRISPHLMMELFKPVLDAISNHVVNHLTGKISNLFLVGGFAESTMLQQAIKNATSGKGINVVIPTDASITIMKGAVLFGLDPTAIRMRTCQMTYGVGEC